MSKPHPTAVHTPKKIAIRSRITGITQIMLTALSIVVNVTKQMFGVREGVSNLYKLIQRKNEDKNYAQVIPIFL